MGGGTNAMRGLELGVSILLRFVVTRVGHTDNTVMDIAIYRLNCLRGRFSEDFQFSNTLPRLLYDVG